MQKIGQFTTPKATDFNSMIHSYTEIQSNRVMQITRYMGPKKYNSNSKLNLLQNKTPSTLKSLKGNYNGVLSSLTKKRISKFLDTWINSMIYHNKHNNSKLEKYNLVFFTLTLSSKQTHSDNEIKRKVFNPFIDYCKRNKTFSNYFWRAEKQKNGNIHFHMIIDKYVDIPKIKVLWNTFQNRLGYVDHFENQQRLKFKKGYFLDENMKYFDKKTKSKKTVSHEIQLKRYTKAKKENFRCPNSIDVRKLNYKLNIVSYLMKYLVKETKKGNKENEKEFEQRKEKEHVCGRIWGCSDKIRSITPFIINSGNDNVHSLLDYCKTSDSVRSYYPEDIPIALHYFKERKDLNRFLEKFDLYFDYELYQCAILYYLYDLERYNGQYSQNYINSMAC